MKKKKKLQRIYSTATAILQEILGEDVELRPHPERMEISVRYCSRVECGGCVFHTFGIGGLSHPDMPYDLPKVIYENVGRHHLAITPKAERTVSGVSMAWGQESVGDA